MLQFDTVQLRERKMRGNEILLVYLCRRIFGLRKRFFKTGVKSRRK